MALFLSDTLKGMALTVLLGGGLLALVIWLYTLVGAFFWVYSWAVVSIFTVLMGMFYTRWIVPLFNKQKPLEAGALKTAIIAYAEKVRFRLENVFVIDGSKRSTKANAYFSGFGKTKRINLYDTLINDLGQDEVVAVLAHEVGHYKRKHIIFSLMASVFVTGLTLYILSLCVNIGAFSYALGSEIPSFHVGLTAFAVLYTPVSGVTGILMNYISRHFEYQADNYAKQTFSAQPLISSLKKLSRNNLSNLTPHPLYVFVHYSHPTLAQRIRNLEQ